VRLLDLCCGEGLAAWGYWLSGRFHEIVGVDVDPEMSSSYSFNFRCGNALELDYEFLMGFDFIHASPPCQGYSRLTPDQSKHPRLIPDFHRMLGAAGKPYCIENVEGSSRELLPNVVMNGYWFGLPSARKRYFHVSSLPSAARLLGRKMNGRQTIYIHRSFVPRADMVTALGLGCINEQRLKYLTVEGMEQGVPPAMTRWIAETVFPDYKALIH
jgi:site-specific DNA-cytosine methylase